MSRSTNVLRRMVRIGGRKVQTAKSRVVRRKLDSGNRKYRVTVTIGVASSETAKLMGFRKLRAIVLSEVEGQSSQLQS